MNKGNSGSRFKLDGRIESPKESMYLIDQLRRKLARNNRRLTFISILGILSFFAIVLLLAMLNYSNRQLKVVTSRTDQAESYVRYFDSLTRSIDSLVLKNLRLKSDNDLLIESSDRLEGIFFEILIGGFEDFNLERYLESIAEIRKQEFDGSRRLVIARFRSFKKALLFENDLKRIGLKDVLIVGTIDGRVVPFRTALEEVQKRE